VVPVLKSNKDRRVRFRWLAAGFLRTVTHKSTDFDVVDYLRGRSFAVFPWLFSGEISSFSTSVDGFVRLDI
jgi:hypothetical protein